MTNATATVEQKISEYQVPAGKVFFLNSAGAVIGQGDVATPWRAPVSPGKTPTAGYTAFPEHTSTIIANGDINMDVVAGAPYAKTIKTGGVFGFFETPETVYHPAALSLLANGNVTADMTDSSASVITTGSIKASYLGGTITADGNVQANRIDANVTTAGDINATRIDGDIITARDITADTATKYSTITNQGNITIKGDAAATITTDGNITVGDTLYGNVTAKGDIKAGNINIRAFPDFITVKADGDINTNSIGIDTTVIGNNIHATGTINGHAIIAKGNVTADWIDGTTIITDGIITARHINKRYAKLLKPGECTEPSDIPCASTTWANVQVSKSPTPPETRTQNTDTSHLTLTASELAEVKAGVAALCNAQGMTLLEQQNNGTPSFSCQKPAAKIQK